ncbi:MAG: hypothetical protein ACKOAH_07430, partial [Pirellula sp.]
MTRTSSCLIVFVCVLSISISQSWGQSTVSEKPTSEKATKADDTKDAKGKETEEEITAKVTKIIDGDSIKVRGADGK